MTPILAIPFRLAVVLAVTGLALWSRPTQAGILDFLFGPSASVPSSSAAPTPARPTSPQPPPARAALPHPPASARVTPTCCRNGENPRDALLADPTLRAGDAVVTRSGIKVFVGSAGAQHSASDFVGPEVAPIPRDVRHQLVEMERNNRRMDGIRLAWDR